MLRSFHTEHFAFEIDLGPLPFDLLLHCEVGFLPADDENFHSFGIKLFEEIIWLRRSGDAITIPEVIAGVTLEEHKEHTNRYSVPIGGDHAADEEIRMQVSIPEIVLHLNDIDTAETKMGVIND